MQMVTIIHYNMNEISPPQFIWTQSSLLSPSPPDQLPGTHTPTDKPILPPSTPPPTVKHCQENNVPLTCPPPPKWSHVPSQRLSQAKDLPSEHHVIPTCPPPPSWSPNLKLEGPEQSKDPPSSPKCLTTKSLDINTPLLVTYNMLKGFKNMFQGKQLWRFIF